MVIRLFIISLLFYSCSMKDDANRNKNNDMEINLSIKQKYNYSDEIFEIFINHEISNNHFVFIKNNETFKANVLTTIQVYDIDNDSIITQNSWENEITEKYYESTRSSTRYLSFSESLNLSSGQYHIRVNIQDIDNSNIFKSQKKIDLSAVEGFGNLSLYLYNDSHPSGTFIINEIDNELKIDNSNIQLSFQYFHDNQKINELLLELNDSNEKYLEKYSDLLMSEDGFYTIEFEIPDNYYNYFNLTLSISDYSITKKLFLENSDNDFWTNDINEIVAVMRYILPVSDIKALKKMEPEQKFEFITNYWFAKDPESDTEENELLIEFTDRVKFVNLKFSDLNKGWRSDRGRIYIIYGPPDMVERYSNQSDGIYEIWEYPSGLKFIFLDRNGFGNFMLVRQTL